MYNEMLVLRNKIVKSMKKLKHSYFWFYFVLVLSHIEKINKINPLFQKDQWRDGFFYQLSFSKLDIKMTGIQMWQFCLSTLHRYIDEISHHQNLWNGTKHLPSCDEIITDPFLFFFNNVKFIFQNFCVVPLFYFEFYFPNNFLLM